MPRPLYGAICLADSCQRLRHDVVKEHGPAGSQEPEADHLVPMKVDDLPADWIVADTWEWQAGIVKAGERSRDELHIVFLDAGCNELPGADYRFART